MKAGKYLFFLLLTLLLSCSGEEEAVTPDKPDKPDDPAEKYRVFLWVDASANYVNLSTAQGIANYVTKAKEIGVTHLVVDVKEPMGEVLYDSKIAPMNLNWKGVTRTRDYDYLRIFIDEARKNNIKVFAALNMFSGGSKSARRGPVYTDPAKKEWASITYNKDGSLQNSIETADQGEVMLNVSRKDVRDYQLSIIEEVITKYPGLDGITLDRCRWDGGFKGDFSTESRELFQKHIGKTLVRYPQDIFEWVYENGNYIRKNGTYFAQWN
ncbi:MAG TPA: family 10 glycosylhydrolase, partial [Prolixibacteraceae bacterium]|nr:family 10 glycosylhydrolase [Prolixibacteraceae bacterium]